MKVKPYTSREIVEKVRDQALDKSAYYAAQGDSEMAFGYKCRADALTWVLEIGVLK